MTQKHREFGLSPNVVTRPATVRCAPCARCGATAGVEHQTAPPVVVIVSCAYCRAPMVMALNHD